MLVPQRGGRWVVKSLSGDLGESARAMMWLGLTFPKFLLGHPVMVVSTSAKLNTEDGYNTLQIVSIASQRMDQKGNHSPSHG
jgi:hypothetical protein